MFLSSLSVCLFVCPHDYLQILNGFARNFHQTFVTNLFITDQQKKTKNIKNMSDIPQTNNIKAVFPANSEPA